jgi:hypothetical protein
VNNKRPTVWVLKEQMRGGDTRAPFDYTPAYKFGDLQFVTDFDLPIHGGSSLAREWHKNVDHCIGKMDAERDFVILTGQPLAMFTFGMKLTFSNTFPRVLVWRREQNEYVIHQPHLSGNLDALSANR